MITVEADADAVERRLAAGGLSCLACADVLVGWGHGRDRQLRGPCACRELRTCSSSGMSILVDDTTETVPPAYGQALDLVGLKGLGPGPQGCCSGK